MIKTYKVRLCPTKEQESFMWQHIGACRYVWNWMLAKQEELYKQGKKHLSAFDMIKLMPILKNDGEHDGKNFKINFLFDCSTRKCGAFLIYGRVPVPTRQ